MNEFAQSLQSKSDQINNTDLTGSEMTITITNVRVSLSEEQKVSIHIAESDRVYRPCLGMRRLIAAIWGIDHETFKGRRMTLYRDPDVKFGKDTTGGIRISHMSNLDQPRQIPIPISQKRFKVYTVKPLIDAPKPKEHAPDPEAQKDALAAAAMGTDTFRAWWSANPAKRADVKGIMDEIESTAASADAAATADNDDPFGLPPVPDRPSQDDIDRAMREAAEAAKEAAE